MRCNSFSIGDTTLDDEIGFASEGCQLIVDQQRRDRFCFSGTPSLVDRKKSLCQRHQWKTKSETSFSFSFLYLCRFSCSFCRSLGKCPEYRIVQEPPTGHPEFLVAEVKLPLIVSPLSCVWDRGSFFSVSD